MSQNLPLISILINCYNAENFIAECIKSVLNQTYKNIEIIIWDNNSTDKTQDIIKLFNDKRIKYYKSKKYQSLAKARVAASKKINGDYIAILDSDDIAYKHKIKTQYEFFISNPDICLIGTWMNTIDKFGKLISSYKPNFNNYDLNSQILWSNPLIHSSIMYKKSTAVKLGWYSNKLTNFQDYALTLKIFSKYKIGIIKEILGAQRLHDSNSIKAKNTYLAQIKEYNLLLRYARRLIPNNINKKKLIRMNNNSILVNNFKKLLFNFNNNSNLKNFLILINFIFLNPIILLHNGYIRKYIIK